MTTPLPPRPDPQTGEPRPPQAPTDPMAGTGDRHPERGEERYLSDPPPGMGPCLEGHRFSRKGVLKAAGFLLIVGIAIGCLFSWLDAGDPLDWVDAWGLWIFIIAFAFGIPLIFMRGATITCGADWLSTGRNWVELYELKRVKLTAPAGRFSLELTDHAGRKIFFSLVNIQRMPYIWNFVYNGIVHSIVAGKSTANKMAIGKLQLPLPTEPTDD